MAVQRNGAEMKSNLEESATELVHPIRGPADEAVVELCPGTAPGRCCGAAGGAGAEVGAPRAGSPAGVEGETRHEFQKVCHCF